MYLPFAISHFTNYDDKEEMQNIMINKFAHSKTICDHVILNGFSIFTVCDLLDLALLES